MRLSGALLALCIVPLCASGANAQAPSVADIAPTGARRSANGASRAYARRVFLSATGRVLRSATTATAGAADAALRPGILQAARRRRKEGGRDQGGERAQGATEGGLSCSSPRSRPPQTKMLKFVNENGQWCGFPAKSSSRSSRAPPKVAEIRTKVCQVAAAPPRPTGPEPERRAQRSGSGLQQHQNRTRHV